MLKGRFLPCFPAEQIYSTKGINVLECPPGGSTYSRKKRLDEPVFDDSSRQHLRLFGQG